MNRLNKLINAFRKSSFPVHKQVVVYAGREMDDDECRSNEFEFGIYVPVSKRKALWLPCTAVDPDVIEQLKNMDVGQAFRLVGEESDGGVGTLVKKIAVEGRLAKYDVGADRPSALKL